MISWVVIRLRALTGAADPLGHLPRDVHGHVPDLRILESVSLLQLVKQEHHGALKIIFNKTSSFEFCYRLLTLTAPEDPENAIPFFIARSMLETPGNFSLISVRNLLSVDMRTSLT